MLQAVVKTRMENFAGRAWKSGDIIPADLLNSDKVSQAAVEVLVKTGVIVLTEEGSESAAGPVELAAKIASLESVVEKLVDRLDALEEKMASFLGAKSPGKNGK